MVSDVDMSDRCRPLVEAPRCTVDGCVARIRRSCGGSLHVFAATESARDDHNRNRTGRLGCIHASCTGGAMRVR
jgi:hypothetical protein